MTQEQLHNLQTARSDILFYAEQVIGVDLEGYQKDVLVAIQQYQKVAWRSGHGVGKTTTAAIAVNWYFDCFPNSRIITTASAWRQVSKQLWPEIHKWRRKANLELIGAQEYESLNLMLKRGEEWFATGEASDEPAKMEGFHAKHLFFVFDEAKAIPDATFEACEGALTTVGAKQLVISTPPPETAGYFYDIFARKKGNYQLFHTNSEQSPRVSSEWIEARKAEWGENSPLYQTRVKGEFSQSGEDLVIPLKWVEECVNRKGVGGAIEIGCDVARFGSDMTVMIVRNGENVVDLQSFSQQDTMETVGRLKNLIDQYKPLRTKVDVIGMGAGVVDRLKELGYDVIGVNVAESASNTEQFQSLRSEIYWGLRERFRDKAISIPNDDTLIGQLANIKYGYNSRGQTIIESKDEMKKRGLKSPDMADALALAYYSPSVAEVNIYI
jgi:phage terminase large subunit